MLETEKTENSLPEYGMKILDYFCAEGSSEQKKRDDYLKRGIIPTNNLSLYFVDEPKAVIHAGIPNPFDYRQLPFGDTIENLKKSNPELWLQATTIKNDYEVAMSKYIEMLQNSEVISPEVESNIEMLFIQKSEIFDKVIRIIGPQLLAIGIEPLELCK